MMVRVLIGSALCLGSSLSFAEQAASYRVQARILDAERLIGQPELQVEAGRAASISVDGDGPDSYTLQLTLNELDGGQLLDIQTDLRTASGRVQPQIGVLPSVHEQTVALARDLESELSRRVNARMVPFVIRYDVAVKEAASK